MKCAGDDKIYFTCLATDDAGDGIIEIELFSDLGIPLSLTGTVLITAGTYAKAECSLTIPAGATDGTMYLVVINVDGQAGTCTFKGGILSVDQV